MILKHDETYCLFLDPLQHYSYWECQLHFKNKNVPSFVCVFICCCQVVIGCSLSIVFLSYQLYFGPFSPHTVSFRFLLRFRASTSFSATFFCHSILRSAYLYFVNCIHILQEIVLIKKKQYIPSKYLINWKYVIAFSDCHLMKKNVVLKIVVYFHY